MDKFLILSDFRWAHAGDDENDKIKDDVYLEDGTMLVEDVCGWTDDTISVTGKFEMSQNTAWSWAAGSPFLSGIYGEYEYRISIYFLNSCPNLNILI